MSTRLMCLLFSDDLTMTDRIPLCSLPTHSPQESEVQETESDRSDNRETEDGGLSGMENNTSFFLFSLPSLHIFHAADAVGHKFANGKRSGFLLWVEKQLWFLCWWWNNGGNDGVHTAMLPVCLSTYHYGRMFVQSVVCLGMIREVSLLFSPSSFLCLFFHSL